MYIYVLSCVCRDTLWMIDLRPRIPTEYVHD
jgi:hypothetical protein